MTSRWKNLFTEGNKLNNRESRIAGLLSSQSKMKLLTLFCFISSISLNYGCKVNNENNSAICASVKELLEVESPRNWQKIEVKSVGGGRNISLNSSAFENVQNVIEVLVSGNNIQDILPHTFNELTKIRNISIMDNQIATLQTNVFIGLPIQALILKNNRIQFIENGAFINTTNLKKLNLHNNELTTFDSKLLLGKPVSLEVLILSRNNLKSLLKDTFSNLANLKSLYLSNNKLETLQTNCFNDLASIETLDISDNNIKEISPKNFPETVNKLQNFYIHNNQLCFFHPDLFQRLSNVRNISYGGNPWQCPCWELLDQWITGRKIARVCHEEFVSGQRPECIVTNFAPLECVYDKDKLNEVPQMFAEESGGLERISNCLDEIHW